MTHVVPAALGDSFRRIGLEALASSAPVAAAGADFPEPEDRGAASLSDLGRVEYVEDLIRPGRIHLWAAEEGSGKSYAVDDELGIRVALAGGRFAGTWPVLQRGPVLYLSEMHPDDDFEREAMTLGSLGHPRAALNGRLFRLPLMTAANGQPALTHEVWRRSITEWLRYRGALMLIFDTATGATQVDPWGKDIQAVFTGLRTMLESYPALAIVLIVHLKKPSGRGARRLSDVLGEWARWADIVVLQENDGNSLERTRITVRKRVRRERSVVATKRDGLLVDPTEASSARAGPKVPSDMVLAAIEAMPGITYAALGVKLSVSKATATRYAASLGGQVSMRGGKRGTVHLYLTAAPSHTAASTPEAVVTSTPADDHRTTARTYQGAAVRGAADEPILEWPGDMRGWDENLAERAIDDDAEGISP